MSEHLLALIFFKGHPDESGGRFVKPDRRNIYQSGNQLEKLMRNFDSSCSTLVFKRCEAESNKMIANKTDL